MKIAYHSFAYGGRSWLPSYDIYEMVRRVGSLGFDALEIGAVRPHAWPRDMDGSAVRRLKSLLGETGLAVSAINPTVINHNLVSAIPRERADAVANCRGCLRLASKLEAPFMTLPPGWRMEGTTMDQAAGWLRRALTDLLPEAERRGVTIVLEAINARRTNFITSTRQVLETVRSFASPHLRAMLDLYHAFMEGEDLPDSIRLLGRDLAYVHFVDAVRGSDTRRVPGRGEAPLAAALAALAGLGYDGYLTVEIWGADPDSLGRQAIEFFQEHRGKAGRS